MSNPKAIGEKLGSSVADDVKSNSTNIFDIDAHLSKLSGDQNYMNSLKSITGDIFDVNIEFWQRRNKQVCNSDDNIDALLKNLIEVQLNEGVPIEVDELEKAKHEELREANASKYKEFMETANDFIKQHAKMDMTHKSMYKNKKKNRWYISDGYRVQDIVESKWWKSIRAIEKAINDFLADILDKKYTEDGELDTNVEKNANINVIAINAVFAKHPEHATMKSILGCHLNEHNIKQFMYIREYCNIIIQIYMLPAYDVRKKIESNYDKLEKIFKSKHAKTMMTSALSKVGESGKIDTSNVSLDVEDVINLLTQFIIAKYRKEITGNTSYYTKLFFDVVGNDNMSAMPASRLLELMDNLDLSSIKDKESAYRFAMSAREIIKKIASGQTLNAEEAIKEIRDLFSDNEVSEEERAAKQRVKELEEPDL